MSQHVRAVDASRGQSAEQLVAICGGIIKGLTDNPAYPNPPVDLKTLQAAVDGLNAAAQKPRSPFGSPVYFCNITAHGTTGLDRMLALGSSKGLANRCRF